ncbi:MAG: sortase [Paracoccaceae bacterium]|nr:sortase [Paracoccaceae bacterium]
MYKMTFMALGCCLVFGGVLGIAKASLMPIKAFIGQHYLEVAWQESLSTNKLSKPWRSADFYMIGELKVPRLNISRVILNSVSGEAMAWGIGRVNNIKSKSSSGPVILAGHRDSHMKFMYELNVGEKIELIMSDGLIKTYVISKTGITNQPELEISESINKKNSLILTTCWPLKSSQQGRQRYIIFSQQAV